MKNNNWKGGLRHCALVLALGLYALGASAQNPWPPQTTITRSSSFEYDSTTGLLTKEVVEPGSSNECVQTTYTHDAWGNRQTVTTANCAGATGTAVFAARTTTTLYTGDAATLNGVAPGSLPVQVQNALGHTETRKFDPRTGQPLQLTGPNGLVTSWQYDAFGRKIAEIRADGTRTLMWYCYVGAGLDTSSNTTEHGTAGSCGSFPAVPAGTESQLASTVTYGTVAYYVHSQSYYTSGTSLVPAGAFQRVYHDQRGRKVRTVTQAFDAPGSNTAGRFIVQDTAYNPNGAVLAETAPYFFDTANPSRRVSTLASASDYATAFGNAQPETLNPALPGGTYTEYDVLGRPLVIYRVDTASEYDARSGGTGSASTIPATAPLGLAGARSNRISYVYDQSAVPGSGAVVRATDDLGRAQTQEKTPQGKVVRATDAEGAQIAFQYDALGNLVRTTDPLNNSVLIGYDRRGNKRWMSDPNKGQWSYEYNALGELVKQTDGKGQVVEIKYDVLGRVTERADKSGLPSAYLSRYFYDTVNGTPTGTKCSSTAVASTKGLLCGSLEVNQGIRRMTDYDALLRPIRETQQITIGSAPSFISYVSYDAASRPRYLTYPTGLRVEQHYTTLGALWKVTNTANGAALWTATQVNALGAVERSTYGNGVTHLTLFDPQNPARSLYTGARIGGDADDSVFKHRYWWDSVNNMLNRHDANGNGDGRAVTETFSYDKLNRLTRYQVASPAIAVAGFQRTVDVSYNVLGNILYKSDVGTYTYPPVGSARPHAVQSVNGPGYNATFAYDNNGNLTQATGSARYRKLTYTSFNMPDAGDTGGVEGANGNRYRWWYDEDQQRLKEVRTSTAGTRTTWYVHPNNTGGLSFEREQAENGAITNRHYISAGGGAIGMLETKETGGALVVNSTVARTITRTEYWHKDHLGSIAAVTEQNVSTTRVVKRFAYDPFGKRRYPDGNADASGALVVDYPNGPDRGFTGHEHLDDVGIVHMNGRLYDPMLGRFMQADPLVQEPYLLQNYNGYSYVLNNPLNATDPSGQEFITFFYYFVGAAITARATGIIDQKTFRSLMAIAVAWYLGPYGAYGAAGATGSAGASAAVAGFASGAIQTGTPEGAVMGAFTGLMFYGAGELGTRLGAATTGFSATRVGLHALAGCASSSMAGGSCEKGAVSAGITKAVGSIVDKEIQGITGLDDHAIRLTAYAIVGGTVSALGGDKFANGALTAAFQYLFNQARQPRLLTQSGHHIVPNETVREVGITSPQALEELDSHNARIPVDRHNGGKPSPHAISHDEYNKLATQETRKWLAENKVNPATMTGEQARSLVQHFKRSAPDPIRQFNQIQYSRALQQAIRKAWHKNPSGKYLE